MRVYKDFTFFILRVRVVRLRRLYYNLDISFRGGTRICKII